MYYAIIGLVFFASLAMMVREGIWSNTITLMNIFFSGLLAFGLYAPLTIMVDEALDGQYTYVLDFVMIWAIFSLSMVIMRIATDKLSTIRLRLKHPLDSIGGPIVGVIGAWVMCSFLAATLHTAPLAKAALGGKLVHADADSPGLSTPDLTWLHFVQRTTSADGYGSGGTIAFEAAPFVKIYADHREKLEKAPGLKVQR